MLIIALSKAPQQIIVVIGQVLHAQNCFGHLSVKNRSHSTKGERLPETSESVNVRQDVS